MGKKSKNVIKIWKNWLPDVLKKWNNNKRIGWQRKQLVPSFLLKWMSFYFFYFWKPTNGGFLGTRWIWWSFETQKINKQTISLPSPMHPCK
jgi:hypothetical protein